jgi:hypothetical protein
MIDDQKAEPETAGAETADAETTESGTTAETHESPHPPFARSPDEYTDPPGHHRRGPHGPALDVGA